MNKDIEKLVDQYNETAVQLIKMYEKHQAERERADKAEERERKLKEYITRMIEADDILFHEPIRWKDTGSKLLKSLYPKEEQV